jgi:UDP-N-acetylmuramoyl-L-alanyl-D-glutamate--2,6-diaminopimelate ligase
VKLSALLSAIPYSLRRPAADPDITAVTADSRQVRPGSLFVAVRGAEADGHDYIRDAVAKGAAAIVAEEVPLVPIVPLIPFVVVPNSREALAYLAAASSGFPARRLVMIGVTGTDGKTTTATLLHSILTQAGIKAGLITTVSAVIGDESLDTGLHTTTPDSSLIQALLARMVAVGLTHCVLEVTSHGLAQHRVTACDFDVAVVTNITHEHLDYHGTYEAYRAAKARLFEGLASAARKAGQAKVAVLNRDDASHDYLRSVLTGPAHDSVCVLTYGLDAAADVTATEVQSLPRDLRFQVRAGASAFQVSTGLVGRFNVYNCLASATVALKGLGLSEASVVAGIAAVAAVPGRMERIDMGQPFTAIVDFAHTPNALKRVLETARQMTAGRVIAVFGSAGLRDREKRRLMPQISAKQADLTILTAEDPRSESLDTILAEMAQACQAAGGVEGQTFWRIADRGEALRFAVSQTRSGDLVIACGKGHEQSMCFGTVEHPWDDRTAMRAALAGLLGVQGPSMPHLPTQD